MNKIYHFGEFRIDSAERRLWCKSEPISLTPKQFDLLFYFVENAGRTAKKSELLDAIWADIYIEETTLARNVSWLRQKLAEYSKGETFIETVPKLGYRFTAEVKHSDENFLIIEEQTVQHIRGQEIITIEDTQSTKVKETKTAKSFAVSVLPILLALVGLLGGGYFLYENNKKAVALPTASNPSSLNARQTINIGSIVHLKSNVSPDAGYLEVWGEIKNKPEFRNIPTEVKFVSTHPNPNRENGSGSWKVVSARGKKDGETLIYGDKIHLQSIYPDGGFLDSCGWIVDMGIFKDFVSYEKLAVFTTATENRDRGSGTWTVGSNTEYHGKPVLEGHPITLENGFVGGGYLNAQGFVMDIPAYHDYDGTHLVFVRASTPNPRPPAGIWIISTSNVTQ